MSSLEDDLFDSFFGEQPAAELAATATEDCLPCDRSFRAVTSLHADENFLSLTSYLHTIPNRADAVTICNKYANLINQELIALHKYCAQLYEKKFPELQSLVPNASQYIQVVKLIGNQNLKDLSKDFNDIISQPVALVIKVTASTTLAEKLSDEDAKLLEDACEYGTTIMATQSIILEFIKQNVTFLAPSLTTLVGAVTAAKLLSAAGSLDKLARMPASAIQNLGMQRKAAAGVSVSGNFTPFAGHIYYSELVQNTEQEYRQKAVRKVAAKCALAVRLDYAKSKNYGADISASSYKFKNELANKLDKISTHSTTKIIKPLPAPVDQIKKRRGGRRVRKMKDLLAKTEIAKLQNRVDFNTPEEMFDQSNYGEGLGMLTSQDINKVRKVQIDHRARITIGKKLQQELHKQKSYGGTLTQAVSGFATVAFTTEKGLSVVNPNLVEKKATSAKYFSDSLLFQKT